MKKLKTKITLAAIKAKCQISATQARLADTSGEGHVDVAVKIIIGVVIGALVLAGLVILWNTVIMPRLNTEIIGMFG